MLGECMKNWGTSELTFQLLFLDFHFYGSLNRVEAPCLRDVVQPQSFKQHPHSNCFQVVISRFAPLPWNRDLHIPLLGCLIGNSNLTRLLIGHPQTAPPTKTWESVLIPLPTPTPEFLAENPSALCSKCCVLRICWFLPTPPSWPPKALPGFLQQFPNRL